MSGPGSLIDDAITDLRARVAALEELHATQPPEPPPTGVTPEWVPVAAELPSIPGATAPALVDWAYLTPARAPTGVSITEIKALQKVERYDGVNDVIIEDHYGDRSLSDPAMRGALTVSGDVTHSNRSGPAYRVTLREPARVRVVVEAAASGLGGLDIMPASGLLVGKEIVFVRRGGSEPRPYDAFIYDLPAGTHDFFGLNGKANFYFLIIEDAGAPYGVVTPADPQHGQYGQKIVFGSNVWAGWHPILDRRAGNWNDHEHGFLTDASAALWKYSDPTAHNSGFKVLELLVDHWRVVINAHFRTSESGRVTKTHHTFDTSVWDERDGSFAGFLPLMADLGRVRAVYGGNQVHPVGGLPDRGGGIRNVTVNLPATGSIEPPHTAPPGYETWQYRFDTPGFPLQGLLTMATDNPVTRLRYKPLVDGAYPWEGNTDVEGNRNDPNPDGARRWFILPNWGAGGRTTIRFVDAPSVPLIEHAGRRFAVWTHNKRGYDARPYDARASVDHARRSLCSIREDVSITIPGASKWFRLETNGQYVTRPEWGTHVPRVPLAYGVIDAHQN